MILVLAVAVRNTRIATVGKNNPGRHYNINDCRFPLPPWRLGIYNFKIIHYAVTVYKLGCQPGDIQSRGIFRALLRGAVRHCLYPGIQDRGENVQVGGYSPEVVGQVVDIRGGGHGYRGTPRALPLL